MRKLYCLIAPLLISSFIARTTFAKNETELPLRSPNPSATITTSLAGVPTAPPGAIITPLKKDQKAPFDGVLLNPEAVANVIVTIDSIPEVVAIEVKKATDTEKTRCTLMTDNLKSDLKYEKDTAATRINSLNEQVDLLNKQLIRAERDKPNLPLWIGAGFVGGVIITVLTVFAVNQASK